MSKEAAAAVWTRAQELTNEYRTDSGEWLDPENKVRFGVRHGRLTPEEILAMIDEVTVEAKDQQKVAEDANQKAQIARSKYEGEARKASMLRDRRDVLKMMLAEKVGIPK